MKPEMNLLEELNSIKDTLEYQSCESTHNQLEEILERHKHAFILYPEVAKKTGESMNHPNLEFYNNERWEASMDCGCQVGNIYYKLPKEPNVTVEELMPEEPLKVGDKVKHHGNNVGEIFLITGESAWIDWGNNHGTQAFTRELKKVKG